MSQPTWDDCQQLLQVLGTTEEREKIRREARKQVLGPDGRPTENLNLIETVLPTTRPDWHPNTERGWGTGPCPFSPGSVDRTSGGGTEAN